jgi:hypothetical protein
MIHEHKCNICNKNYASKQSLWNHNNKFHNNIISQKSAKNQSKNHPTSVKNQPIVIQSVLDTKHNILECKYCNKSYKHIQSRWKHEQKCKVKSNNDEIMELKKKLKDIEDKINNTHQGSTITNSNNTNTLNNKGTINNNYIIAFGKEEINNILTEKEKIRILNARYKSLEESIKAIHFNDNRPEYQNIVITNMRDNLVHIFDGNKFVSQAKHGTINQLIDNHMESIEESLDNSRERLNPKTVDIIEKLIEKINDETTELYDEENDKKYLNYKNYKNDLVKLFVYNESDNKKPSKSLVNKKKKEIDL